MNLAPVLRQRYLDANGAPLAGGSLYSYQAGTTTPLATYLDATGTTNTNPVVLDSQGYADVWLDPTLAYKFVLKDAGGATVWTVDNVTYANGVTTWNANTIYQQGQLALDSSGTGMVYVSLTNSNQAQPLSNVSAWRVFGGNIRSVSASSTLAVTDDLVRSNSTSGALTHTLPACATTPVGKRITIKDIGTGGNTTTVKGSGTDNVDGANTFGTALIQYQSATFENDGSSWGSFGIAADKSVSTAKLAVGAVTQDRLAARATGTTVAAGGVAISSSCGVYTVTSSLAAVTNLSVTITTTGRPVWVGLVADGSANTADIFISNSINPGTLAALQVNVEIFRGASAIAIQEVSSSVTVVPQPSTILQCSAGVPVSVVQHIDTGVAGSAGTYTYAVKSIYSNLSGSCTGTISYAKLVAYEL